MDFLQVFRFLTKLFYFRPFVKTQSTLDMYRVKVGEINRLFTERAH